MIYYSNEVDSLETLPLTHEHYSWVSKDLAMSSGSEVGCPFYYLPHSIIRGVING